MADPRRIEQQLDAFRVGHDDGQLEDLRDAAQALDRDEHLAAAFQRSQALDHLVKEALDDAPVPDGLEAQLLRLTRLAETPDGESVASSVDGENELEADVVTLPTRRKIVWLTGAAALAASLMAIVFLQPSPPQALTGAEIAEQVNRQAPRWTADESLAWQQTPSPKSHPMDPAVKLGDSHWTTVDILGDSQAVLHRRKLRRGNVYLLIAKGAASAVGSTPPLPPQWDTGSRRIGVWSSLGNVYVLVVEGDIDDYKQMIREPYAA